MYTAHFIDRSGGVRDKVGLGMVGLQEAVAQAKSVFATIQIRLSDVAGFRIVDSAGNEAHVWMAPHA